MTRKQHHNLLSWMFLGASFVCSAAALFTILDIMKDPVRAPLPLFGVGFALLLMSALNLKWCVEIAKRAGREK